MSLNPTMTQEEVQNWKVLMNYLAGLLQFSFNKHFLHFSQVFQAKYQRTLRDANVTPIQHRENNTEFNCG